MTLSGAPDASSEPGVALTTPEHQSPTARRGASHRDARPRRRRLRMSWPRTGEHPAAVSVALGVAGPLPSSRPGPGEVGSSCSTGLTALCSTPRPPSTDRASSATPCRSCCSATRSVRSSGGRRYSGSWSPPSSPSRPGRSVAWSTARCPRASARGCSTPSTRSSSSVSAPGGLPHARLCPAAGFRGVASLGRAAGGLAQLASGAVVGGARRVRRAVHFAWIGGVVLVALVVWRHRAATIRWAFGLVVVTAALCAYAIVPAVGHATREVRRPGGSRLRRVLRPRRRAARGAGRGRAPPGVPPLGARGRGARGVPGARLHSHPLRGPGRADPTQPLPGIRGQSQPSARPGGGTVGTQHHQPVGDQLAGGPTPRRRSSSSSRNWSSSELPAPPRGKRIETLRRAGGVVGASSSTSSQEKLCDDLATSARGWRCRAGRARRRGPRRCARTAGGARRAPRGCRL